MGVGCFAIHVKFYTTGPSKDELVSLISGVGKLGTPLQHFSRQTDVTGWVDSFDVKKLEAYYFGDAWAETLDRYSKAKELFTSLCSTAPGISCCAAYHYIETVTNQEWMVYVAGDETGVQVSDDAYLRWEDNYDTAPVTISLVLTDGEVIIGIKKIGPHCVFKEKSIVPKSIRSVGNIFEKIKNMFHDDQCMDLDNNEAWEDEDEWGYDEDFDAVGAVGAVCGNLSRPITAADISRIVVSANSVFNPKATVYGKSGNNAISDADDVDKMLLGDVTLTYEFPSEKKTVEWIYPFIGNQIVKSFSTNHKAASSVKPDDLTVEDLSEDAFYLDLSALTQKFPLTIPIEGTHVLGRAQRLETILIGDRIVLAADWKTNFFDPLGIEVFNEAGETLGYLQKRNTILDMFSQELACLLPFVTAHATSVVPLSQLPGKKYAYMDVRLDLDEGLLDETQAFFDPTIYKSVKKLLALPKIKRVTVSHSSLEPSQLQGNIDTSKALSNPYGIG